MNIPQNLRYTKEHEWLLVEGNKATVGITDFAQKELGDIVYVEVETLGKTLNQGEVFGSIEAVKTVSDLFLPVAGTVDEFNADINSQPELVNKEPYTKGWIIKMTLSNPADVEQLLDAVAYTNLIG